jgi:hypothetical protein
MQSTMTAPRAWITSLTIAALAGIVVSAWTMAAAWAHNPNGEFHESLGIHWQAWLAIGASWFLPTFAITLLGVRALLTPFVANPPHHDSDRGPAL